MRYKFPVFSLLIKFSSLHRYTLNCLSKPCLSELVTWAGTLFDSWL